MTLCVILALCEGLGSLAPVSQAIYDRSLSGLSFENRILCRSRQTETELHLAASTAGPASVKAAEPQGTNDQFFIGLDGLPSSPVQV